MDATRPSVGAESSAAIGSRSTPASGGPSRSIAEQDGHPPDAILHARMLEGDETAFRLVAERHGLRLHAVATRLLGDASEAEDAVQDALVRLWQRADQVTVDAPGLFPWLRRVTTNLCLDRIRQRRDHDPDALETLETPADQEDALANADRATRVNAAIVALPPRQRLAVTLFHFEMHSLKETATQLDTTEEAVESLLGRARRTLKASLNDLIEELL